MSRTLIHRSIAARRIGMHAAASLVTLAGISPAFCQTAPPNDNCNGATPVVVGANAISNRDAEWEQDGRGCPNGISFASVFYRFTAPTSAVYTASTCGGVTWNSRLAVFRDCGNSQSIACSGDATGCGLASEVSWGAQAGVTYIIRLSGESQGAQGGGTMTISSSGPAGPANDTCANARAINLTGALTPITGTNIGANTDGSATCGGQRDVWFSYTPQFTHTLDLAMCDGDFAPVMSIHTGACGGLTQIACSTSGNQGPCPTQGRPFIRTLVTAGTQYFIRVAGVGGASGNFNLLPLLGVATNDNCADALPITPGTPIQSTTVGTMTDGNPSCGGGADVWYWYRPSSTRSVRFAVCTEDWTPMLTLYEGTCGSMREVVCNGNNPSPGCLGGATVTACLTGGTAYLLRVAGVTSSNDGDFSLFAEQVGATSPADACEAGTVVGTGSTAFSTANACADGYASCAGPANAPVKWFTYTAPCSGDTTFSTCGSSFDTTLSLFEGNCDAMNRVACNDNSPGVCSGSPQSSISFSVVGGTTYHVRVSGNSSQGGAGTLTISSAAPPNALCVNPEVLTVGATASGLVNGCSSRDVASPCDPAGATGGDVWYSITPTANAVIGLTLCSEQVVTTALSVYTGSCENLTHLTCAVNNTPGRCGANNSAQVQFAGFAGTRYLVRVAGRNAADLFRFTLLAETVLDAPLILNGSFEAATGPALLPMGSTSIQGWTVSRGNIDWFGAWQNADGNYSLDLQGHTSAGGIQQTVFTTPNHRYRLTFAMAGNPDGGSVIKHMRVRAGSQSADFEFDTTGRSHQNMGWVDRSMDFTAFSDTTQIEFYSLDAPSFWGATLDRVSMVELVCAADINRDFVVDSRDFFDFLTNFFKVDPAADFNTDGAVNSQDFFAFLASFFAGCM